MLDKYVYDLSEEEYKDCLARAEIAVFGRCESVKEPKSIFVVAQPGAGKTALRSYVVNEAQNAGKFAKFVEFNPDEIAIHHKYYREILRDFPEDSYEILKRFTYRAQDFYLRQRAVDLKCNILQEGTFATTDGYLGIINYQQGNGYDIDINVLAVNRFESLLSSFEREQFFIENDLPPRPVMIENHDYSYEKMLETLDAVENRHAFNQLRVFKRGYFAEKPELIYAAGDNRFPSVREAVVYERKMQEKQILENPAPYFERIEKLKERGLNNDNESLKNRIAKFEEILQERVKEYKEEEHALL